MSIGDLNFAPNGMPERTIDPPLFPDAPTQLHLILVAKEAQFVYRRLLLRREVGGEGGLDHRIRYALGQLLDAEEDLAGCGLYLLADGDIVDLPTDRWKATA